MTPAQCRAARALVNWTQPHLAEAAGVSPSTLRDFESGKRVPIANNLAAIRTSLESAGVTFLENGDVAPGAGVALRW
ncbi:helix-turn-helix transcriptional regulator [Ensifer sp.]|uniref:helix-turn-helix domain-containing protein n=1 Tax=Ensifer sp. TaxID=1872086 RepID=UPI002E126467|nr:helix-turn-helix transcriptional regulator [Ensifer sp.]